MMGWTRVVVNSDLREWDATRRAAREADDYISPRRGAAYIIRGSSLTLRYGAHVNRVVGAVLQGPVSDRQRGTWRVDNNSPLFCFSRREVEKAFKTSRKRGV